jgi:cytochrome c-type biogenesis protein CcmE
MMRKSRQRLIIIGSAAVVLAAAIGLAAVGLKSSAAFFRTPSQISELMASQGLPDRAIRVGGLVTIGSVRTDEGGVLFELADDQDAIEVAFAGVLPSLFREGQCVIAEGEVGPDGRLSATRVLAKHDEEYRAPEITSSPRLANSCGEPAQTAMTATS